MHKSYRINSTGFLFTPGFVRWLRETRPPNAQDLWEGLGFSAELARALVGNPGAFSFEDDGEDVVITDRREQEEASA